jgi:hypothetical protein
METQILQRPVYMDAQHQATLRCPGCGRTKVADMTRYQNAPKPPKVKCACGQRFRVPIAVSLSARYTCQTCAGKGYLVIEQGKKVTVSEAGYHYQMLQSKEPCTICSGLGVCYPRPASGGWRATLHSGLAFLATHALARIEWLTEKLGASGPSVRTWLEMDIYALGSMDIVELCKGKTLAGAR